MIEPVSILAAGIVLLYLGAEALVRGAVSCAKRFEINPLIVGITVIAYGTSMPELVVSVQAALSNAADLAVGNIVGSNICTIGVVLGATALVRPINVKLQMIRWHVPLMIAGSIVLCLLLWDGSLSRWEGSLLVGGGIAYTLANLRAARQEQSPEVQAQFEQAVGTAHKALWIDALLILGGLLALYFGGNLIIGGGGGIARHLGISEAVIGLTVVALGTSCPDLMASVIAAKKGEGDLAVGNVIGSVLFNILSALGVAIVVKPMSGFHIAPLDLIVMVGIVALTLPLMRTGYKLRRWEGGMLILIYCGYIAARWPR